MVVAFKLRPGRQMIFPIDEINVEQQIANRRPWFVKGTPPDVDRHFAVCPYCDNPVQMWGLYKSKRRPYGKHTGKPLSGFAFDATRHKYCPYVLKKASQPRNSRRAFDAMAQELISLTVSEFDRIIYILKDEYGFPISPRLAEEMLRGWFGQQAYLYTGAHPRNVPWMVGYLSGSVGLFGRKIGSNAELASAITDNVPGAIVDQNGQLVRSGPRFEVRMQTLAHRAILKDHVLVETMQVRVQDFTSASQPSDAPVLHSFEIKFTPERFEALMATPPSRARRDERFLEIARKVEGEYL